jgi:2-methylaconitate cis-trans-isomerase PrpF
VAREVKIFNTGTQKVLIAHVPIDSGTRKSISEGEFAIAAVPGTGARCEWVRKYTKDLLIYSDSRSFAE